MNGCHTVIRPEYLRRFHLFLFLGGPVRVPALSDRAFHPRLHSATAAAAARFSPLRAFSPDRRSVNPLPATMLKLIVLAALAGFTQASDVLELTDNDFESKIGDHELILVEFFAPW